ncbi:hypothetical protein AGROH133_14967 (plasmid) [Agrobacterium tumefaciens]|nr:hypothetical protein AGROH133_14967 [Agrobacterium tumefaciens]
MSFDRQFVQALTSSIRLHFFNVLRSRSHSGVGILLAIGPTYSSASIGDIADG